MGKDKEPVSEKKQTYEIFCPVTNHPYQEFQSNVGRRRFDLRVCTDQHLETLKELQESDPKLFAHLINGGHLFRIRPKKT